MAQISDRIARSQFETESPLKIARIRAFANASTRLKLGSCETMTLPWGDTLASSLWGFLRLGLFCFAGEGDGESGSFTELALSLDVTAEHSAKSATDGEAEACASVFACGGFVGLGEWFEEPFNLRRLHSNACV